MSDIASKLSHLIETKTKIKEAIVAKGMEVPDETTFRGYADLIGGIKSEPALQEKSVTENGEVTPDDGYDGLSKVTVDVPETIPDGYIQPNGSKEIIANGIHDVTEFQSVEVNVPTESGETTKVGPLYIAENGTYDHAYKAGSVTWNETTEYDFWLPLEEGLTVGLKKVTDLIVPEHINYLISTAYTITFKLPDGTEQAMPLKELDMFSMDDAGSCYMSQTLYYAVVWVKNAAVVNAYIGAQVFEDNSVYITNFFWAIEPEEMTGVELTLVAPCERLDGISSVEVSAKADPILQEKVIDITSSGQYLASPDEGYDGLSYVEVRANFDYYDGSIIVNEF